MADNGQSEIEVFYDSDCNLCDREVAWLRQRDTHGRVQFTDIAAPGFDADRDAGMPIMRLEDCIQARLPSGEVLEGVAAFRHLYDTVGSLRLERLAGVPVVTPILDGAYRLLAKNRLRAAGRDISRTCTAVRMPRSWAAMLAWRAGSAATAAKAADEGRGQQGEGQQGSGGRAVHGA